MPTAAHNHHNSDSESDSGSDGHPPPEHEGFAEFSRDDSPPTEEIAADEFPRYFLEFGGRLWHASHTSPYPLPVDTREQERLNALHVLTNELIGANYVGPVPDVLVQTDRQKYVLDLCTGTGTWAMDVAGTFPHVLFRGIDIVPIATRYPLPNVEFEVGDVSEEFHWTDEQFDLIHARDISMAVLDYRTILPEVIRTLRPGGMFLSCEWEAAVFIRPGPGEPFDPTQDAPACAQFFQDLRSALWARGIRTAIANIPTYLYQTGVFQVHRSIAYVPIGTWHSDPAMREIGRGLCAIYERFADSIKPLLLQNHSLEYVEALVHHFITELRTVHGLVGAYHIVYGIKFQLDGVSRA